MGCRRLSYYETSKPPLRIVKDKPEKVVVVYWWIELNDGKVMQGWLLPDPAMQFSNPYLGIANNPVNFTDPDGELAWAIGAAIGGLTGLIKGKQAGLRGNDLFGYIFNSAAIGGLGAGMGAGISAGFGTVLGGGLTLGGSLAAGSIGGASAGAFLGGMQANLDNEVLGTKINPDNAAWKGAALGFVTGAVFSGSKFLTTRSKLLGPKPMIETSPSSNSEVNSLASDNSEYYDYFASDQAVPSKYTLRKIYLKSRLEFLRDVGNNFYGSPEDDVPLKVFNEAVLYPEESVAAKLAPQLVGQNAEVNAMVYKQYPTGGAIPTNASGYGGEPVSPEAYPFFSYPGTIDHGNSSFQISMRIQWHIPNIGPNPGNKLFPNHVVFIP